MEKIETQQFSKEQIAELEKTRTISDAELLKGGAKYEIDENSNKKLIPTDQQIESAGIEMNIDLDKNRTLVDKIKLAVKDGNKELVDSLFREFKEKYEPDLRSYLIGYNVSKFNKSARRFKSNFFEDVIQETFLKAYKNIDLLSEEINVVAWLNKVCRNAFIDRTRQIKRSDARESEQYLAQLSLENDVASTELGPSETLDHNELIVILKKAIDNISSAPIKETAKMIYIDGLDAEEIMLKQNITRDNYDKRWQRARKDIKDQLDSMGITEDEVLPLFK